MPKPRAPGHSRRRASWWSATRMRRRPRAMCCSRPAMAPRACRISAPSARWCAPPWCGSAFQRLSDIPTRLFAFSDDMDGLRKVPTNVPNQEMLAQHLGRPLTKVPDPFGTHESFGHHNNAMLRGFLDAFGFEYEFQSSTEMLPVRPLRRRAARSAAALRQDHGGHAADACARSAPRPIRRSCRSARRPARCCRCRSRSTTSPPAPSSTTTRTAATWRRR